MKHKSRNSSLATLVPALIMLVVTGAMGSSVGAGVIVPAIRAHTVYRPTTCTVIARELVPSDSDYHPQLTFTHTLGDQVYRTTGYAPARQSLDRARARAVIEGFTIGQRYPCWYDPANPARAVLTLEVSWLGVAVGTGIFLMFLAATMFLFWRALRGFGRSDEALQARAAPPPADAGASPPAGDPYRSGRSGGGALARYGAALERLPLPEIRKLEGAHLPVRLASDAQENDGSTGLLVLGGSGSAVSFIALMQSLHEGAGTSAVIAGCVLAGGASMIWTSLRESLGSWVRRVVVEIAEEPVLLGSSLPVRVVLPGPGRLSHVRVSICCIERVQISHGSDTRYEADVVWEKELLEERSLKIERGSSWVRSLTAELPAGGMHSFKAPYNEITWAIALEVMVDGHEKKTLFRLRALPEA